MLFPPLTGMEPTKEASIFVNGKKLRHLHFRITCNQRAVKIEDLVARRKLQCTNMVDNMLVELKKAGASEAIAQFMRGHGAEIKRRDVSW